MSGVTAGRPRAISEVNVIMLEHALKRGSSVAEACRYAGIGRTTYYDELERNAQFANRMSYAKCWLGMQAKTIIAEAIITDHNSRTAKWFLEHRHPAYAA